MIKKAITFSFDDGKTQDRRLIDIMNKYGLKGTFNLNSGTLGLKGESVHGKKIVNRTTVKHSEIKNLYNGHEVASHTLLHPNLTEQDNDAIIWQVETDTKLLSNLMGYEVVGFAYPCGGVNNDERVAKIIKNNTGVKYARTITDTYSFDPQDNLLRFNPTVYYTKYEKMIELAEKFLKMQTESFSLFYIWGHSYELDIGEGINWEKFEDFCKLISNHKDIFYGTNKEILLK